MQHLPSQLEAVIQPFTSVAVEESLDLRSVEDFLVDSSDSLGLVLGARGDGDLQK